jgi:uncharacterized membrane protein YfcA
MVSVPILALIDPLLAPVPQLLITLPLTLSMAWRERAHVVLKGVGWVVAGRFPGAAIGVLLLGAATQQVLELSIAALVIVAVVIIASGLHLQRTPISEFGAGVFSGVSGLVASIGGPPLALLYTRDEGPVVRSNLASVFAIGIAINITARVVSGNISWDDVRVAAILFPALVLGYLVSGLVKDRMSQPLVRSSILVLSLVGATGLLIRALL